MLATSSATKKEQVVQLANHDPFLRIAEIAVAAGTTERYVRTVLSEAKLSLSQMRHQYARSMEERLHAGSQLQARPEGRHTTAAEGLREVAPRVDRVTDPLAAALLQINAHALLWRYSRLMSGDGKTLLFLQTLVADQPEFGQAAQTAPHRQAVADLITFAQGVRTQHKLEVLPADAMVAQYLRLTKGSPVLRLQYVAATDNTPVAVHYEFCDAYRVRIEIADSACGLYRVTPKQIAAK